MNMLQTEGIKFEMVTVTKWKWLWLFSLRATNTWNDCRTKRPCDDEKYVVHDNGQMVPLYCSKRLAEKVSDPQLESMQKN